MLAKSAAGMVAGAIGSAVASPADLCLVRMQGDARLPVEQRRCYTNVANALIRIVREEGVPTLWRVQLKFSIFQLMFCESSKGEL